MRLSAQAPSSHHHLPRATLSRRRPAVSGIAGLLVRIDVPDDVVGQSVDAVAGPLGHFGEALGLGLVLECVGREVDTGAVNIGLDQNVDTTDAVQWDFNVLVLTPIAHLGHVCAAGVVLLVTCEEIFVSVCGARRITMEMNVPSARTVSLSSEAASLRPFSDSCHEL